MNAQTRMNAYAALSTAEAAKEYQSTAAQDIASIEAIRKEEVFDDLVSGRIIPHIDSNNNLALFNYENIFDFFTVDSEINEFNALAGAIQKLREELNESKGNEDNSPAFKRLIASVEAVTDIIDKKAKGHIDEYYEEICRHQDSGIHYTA